MIKALAERKIPLYFTVMLLLLAAAIMTGVFFYFLPETINNYKLYIPEAGENPREFTYGSWPALQNSNFYNQVRDRMITEKTSFIEANLSDMKLTVYEGGKAVQEFPILTKGRPGSWWETPAGLYKIEVKEKNHFSGFAGVYLPWSLPFQGNFFIHGWPYYPNGTPVNSQYSGGCIRLSTEDAEKVFARVAVGTPVLVYSSDFASDDFNYRFHTPIFNAKAYLAADINSDFVFSEQNPEIQMPIASLTKLMTALVAVEYINIEKELTVFPANIIPTSKPRLKAGQKISLYNLLPLLLMESSNEAAEVIATHMGRIRFIELMNEKAKAIGMLHTTFTDASGRDDGNVSTAKDLFELAKYLDHNRSFILKISRGEVDQRVYGPLLYGDIRSFNGWNDSPDYIGGKTGLTRAAGETIISIFDVMIGAERRRMAVILLNTTDEFMETEKIVDWVKANYY